MRSEPGPGVQPGPSTGELTWMISSLTLILRRSELKTAMAELAAFVEQNEPRIISYSVCFSEDGSTMSVLHFHPDLASLEFHMKVAGPKFPPVAPLIKMKTIEIFGRPRGPRGATSREGTAPRHRIRHCP